MPKTSVSSHDDPERQLMIKTKICQRLIKEVSFYKDEVQINEKKLDEIQRDATKDIYDIRRYEDILNESYMMVPDATKRLQTAMEDLSFHLHQNSEKLDAAGSWYMIAQQLLMSQDDSVAYRPTSFAEDKIFIETNIDDLKDGEAF